MKKSIKRTLSLLLALTMVLSLGLPAYAINIDDVDYEEKTFESIDEPIGAKETELTEKDDPHPAAEFSFVGEDGFAVEVSAPEGALPFGAEMRVERLNDLADVQAAVDNAEGLQGNVHLAADISFWLDDQEIEPAEGTKLLVRMSAPEIEGIAEPIVIHIPDGENAVPEIVEQLGSSDIILANTVSFEADDFSVYAVIGEVIIEDGAGSIDFESDDYIVTVTYTEEAKIPVGTKLTVSEIPFGTDEYFEYRAAAQDKLNENAVISNSELEPDTRRGIADAIFVDVSLEYNGKPFEPAVPLDVKITLKEGALFCPAGEDAYVVHFGDKGTELIEDVALGLSAMEPGDGMPEGVLLNSFDYEQNGFSVVGLISTDKFIDFEAAVPASAVPTADQLLASIVRAAGDPTIDAGKTVTDNNGDGVYELALSVKATSQQSTTTSVQKSNVVLVIDVSGSMGNEQSWIYYDTYTYNADTYDQFRYYTSSTSTSTRLYYGTYYRWQGNRWVAQGPGWYSGNQYGGTAYSGTVYAYETRLHATQRAACAVVDALLAYNVNDDNITDMFEITVVKFANRTANTSQGYNGTEMVIRDSTSATAIKNAINGLTSGGGTNWQAALETALTEANYYKNTDTSQMHDPEELTSVIFLTDGFPTFYGNDSGTGGENNSNISTSYTNSRTAARNIISNGYTLYNIFAFGSDTTTYNNHTGFAYLRALTNYAYGSGDTDNYNETDTTRQHCFNAKSTADLVAAFNTIINHITNQVGYAGVNLSDGVSLGATSTSVAVNGTAKADSMRYTVKDESGKIAYTVKFSNGTATFTIYNADGTTKTLTDSTPETVPTTIGSTTIESQVYSVKDGEGNDAPTYEMSPATIDADTGMVTWDLAGLGILKSGYTYTVAFDVWPNQVAYDICADLNNGIYATVDEALTAYGVTDATERQHIKDALVHNADGSYSLYTNYSQNVEYYPATSETDDEGNVTWTYGEKQKQDIPQPDPIPLEGSLLPLAKVWESNLAISELNELLWENGEVGGTSLEYQITLYVWKADTETALMDLVETGVTDTNKPYITETLGWDSETSSYIWEKDVAVAPGMMLNLDEAAALGYDTTETAKLRTFTNDEGTTLTYYVIEDGHYYYVTENGSDLHFELEAPLYHPMIVDGTLYNVFFGPNGTVTKMDPMYAVTATNFLKGGLNINKIITDFEGNVIEGVEDEFAFKITLWKEDEEGNISPVYTYDDQFGAKDKNGNLDPDLAISGSIGYREFGMGEDGKFVTLGRDVILFTDSTNASTRMEKNDRGTTNDPVYATKTSDNKTQIILRMPANGEIRIVNLPRDTKYTVEEIIDTSDDAVYEYVKTESYLKYSTDNEEEEGEEGGSSSESQEVIEKLSENTNNLGSGTISGNKANLEKFTNKTDAFFYVYHSADNTIEKIPFSDNRVKGTFDAKTNKYSYTFNIANETKEHFLYAGYYKSGFSGAKVTTAEAAAALPYDKATYNTAYDGEHKDGQWASDTTGYAPYLGDKAMWTGTAETADGMKLAVKVNDFFILRECPDVYIRAVLRYTYYDNPDRDGAAYPVGTVWLTCAIDDDAVYSEYGLLTGIEVTEGTVNTIAPIENKVAQNKGKVTEKLTIQPLTPGKTPKSYTAADLLKSIDSSYTLGYVLYNKVWDIEGDVTALIEDNDPTAMYWVTQDGVRVTGVRVCSVNNIDGNGKESSATDYIKLTKTEVLSTLADLNENS